MRPLRIGLIGKMRAGKDTAAKLFMDRFGGKVLKFAGPLYEMQDAIYKIIGEEPPMVNGEPKDRRLLQLLGTEWGREMRPTIWVDTLLKRAAECRDHIYVTDVRFPNEAEALHNAGFKLIRIHRSDALRVGAGASSESHASETSIDLINPELIDAEVEARTELRFLEGQLMTLGCLDYPAFPGTFLER